MRTKSSHRTTRRRKRPASGAGVARLVQGPSPEHPEAALANSAVDGLGSQHPFGDSVSVPPRGGWWVMPEGLPGQASAVCSSGGGENDLGPIRAGRREPDTALSGSSRIRRRLARSGFGARSRTPGRQQGLRPRRCRRRRSPRSADGTCRGRLIGRRGRCGWLRGRRCLLRGVRRLGLRLGAGGESQCGHRGGNQSAGAADGCASHDPPVGSVPSSRGAWNAACLKAPKVRRSPSSTGVLESRGQQPRSPVACWNALGEQRGVATIPRAVAR